MPRAKTAKDLGLAEAWKVRVIFNGAIVHVISRTEPAVRRRIDGLLEGVTWDLVECAHGDSVGFIRWTDVVAVTWRKA